MYLLACCAYRHLWTAYIILNQPYFFQLVRLVGASPTSLDNAYHRVRYIRIWHDDYLVSCLSLAQRSCFQRLACFSLPIQLYLVDAFSYAASALSAASVFRSLLGFAFPLFGQQMYAKLGYGGGNSLLAGLSIVIGIPFPIWIWFKGEEIRKRSSLAR